MTRLLPFTMVAVCTYNTAAQQTFEKFYMSAASYKFNLIELESSNIFLSMGGAVIVDPEGNVIHNNYYWGSSILNLQSIRRYSDNEFYFVTGYQMDSCESNGSLTIPYTCPMIGKMDSLGNVQFLRYYQLNTSSCWNLSGDLEVTDGKSIIAWGRKPAFFALMSDSIGQPVWAKHFGNRGTFQFIKELPGGDLLAGINMDTAGAVVARLDADGSFLWCKSYMRPQGVVHDALIESDGSIVFIGFTESSDVNIFTPLPPAYRPRLFMMKMNGASVVQWCRSYTIDPYRWYAMQSARIEKTLDNNYVVLADIGTHENGLNYNSWSRPFLMKTDVNGDTIWTRSFGVSDYTYSTSDLLACSDGSYLLGGAAFGDFGAWAGSSYLFKSDSLGHLACSEVSPPPIIIQDLFPIDSNFVLSSADGALDLTASVIDTVYGSIPILDGCAITGVHPSILPARKPRIRPNPNTGHFTLEVQDPLMAESYYSVYDALGKLLYQRPLPTGATVEEIDLSRFGRGTYLIKLTDPEGSRYERVVLE